MEEENNYQSVSSIRIPSKRMDELKKFRADIEKLCGVEIEITDSVKISGESFNVFNASSVIKAIGRGFSFEEACKILKECSLYVIPISSSRKDLKRIRARLIGKSGKVRKKIEELTQTSISIYGKTVSIIGMGDGLEAARCAVEKIIEGKSHSAVFKFLETKNKN